MGSLVAFHREVKAVLETVLPTFYGPADTLPKDPAGRVQQCAVLWPTTGTETTRNAGGVHERTDTVRVVFVGPTVLDCLAAVQKGRAVLADTHLAASGAGGGMLREAGFTGADPVPEPGTDPVRVSLSVQFDVITKEPR